MACLCAPTTHEGSFRCRLHRAAPLVTNSAQSAASTHQKGAFASSPEISDQPSHVPARESPSSAAAPVIQVNCNLPLSSSSSSSSSSPAASTLPSPPPPSRYARPPPAKRAISSSTSLSRSLYPGSSTSELSAATRCTASPSASHAAALAIMKQHLHNKHSTKSHANRNNTVLRASSVYKIGPSRLSRMGRACADEVPLLKKVDCCTPNPPPQNMLSLKSSSFNSDEPQARGLTSVEATQINFKMRSTIAKFKQSESSCKIVGHKAGLFIVSAVY